MLPPRLLETSAKYSVIGVIALFLTWKLAESFDARLSAAQEQLTELAQKIDAAETERRMSEAHMRAILRGICYGTSGDLPRAKALCDLGDR